VQVVLRRRRLRRPRDLVAHPPPARRGGGEGRGQRGWLARRRRGVLRPRAVAGGVGRRRSGFLPAVEEGCLEVCRVGEPNPLLCPPG
jgi:hypothetical protein